MNVKIKIKYKENKKIKIEFLSNKNFLSLNDIFCRRENPKRLLCALEKNYFRNYMYI